MEHFHEADQLDDAVIKMKKYWENPKVYEFETEIREINKDLIRLEENYFYPEGGGQPSDQGALYSDDMQVRIKDVQERDNIVWLSADHSELEEGQLIHAKIDQSRRETLTRNHSGQHLLSAVFWDEFDLDTTRALIDLQETEIEFNRTPSWEELEVGLNMANTYIKEAHPIFSKFYDDSNIEKINIRGGVDSSHKVYRLVEIESIDLNACGGTHVTNTSSIEMVAIQKLDGKRLKFISGSQAKKNLISNELMIHQLSRDIATSPEEFRDEVLRLYNQNKELQKFNFNLENDLLLAQLQNEDKLVESGYQIRHVEVENLNRGLILDFLGELEEKEISLVTTPKAGFILTTGHEDLTSKLIGYLRQKNVRGGGRGTTVMGSYPEELDIIASLSEFLQSIS